MGKSASGKDHFYEALLQDPSLDLQPLILYTTRPIRSGERNGREYFFVDEKKLESLRLAGKLIEERVYQTMAGPWHYFTADEGQIDLENQDYLGIGTLDSYGKMKEYFGEELKYFLPEYILLFIGTIFIFISFLHCIKHVNIIICLFFTNFYIH